MKVLQVPDSCLDLSLINTSDSGFFQEAVQKCKIKSCHYYFPRLLFGGQRKSRLLLFEQIDGSILLYTLRKIDSRLDLCLYVPPFPFSPVALQWAKERVHDFNRVRTSRIDWVQEEDASLIEGHGFSVELIDREFIYDRAAVVNLEGPTFARVRRYLAGLKKYDRLVVREFSSADEEPCLALYRRFRAQLNSKGIGPKGYSTMINSLKGATDLPEFMLKSEVFEIDGNIRAYSLGGPINVDYGCVFLAVSDHEFPGLAYALRHQMMKNFPGLTYFNDTTDNGRLGLREMKQRFRPVEMHGVFRARETK